MSDQPPPPGEPEHDWRQMSREERWQHRHERHYARWRQNGPWIGGVILIVLGVIFLLQNFGFPLPQNWWAVFILIPAAAAFNGAWQTYRRKGQVTAGVSAAAISGTILTLLAVAFFFNFDFGKYWPVILILLGIAALSGGFWRRNGGPPAT